MPDSYAVRWARPESSTKRMFRRPSRLYYAPSPETTWGMRGLRVGVISRHLTGAAPLACLDARAGVGGGLVPGVVGGDHYPIQVAAERNRHLELHQIRQAGDGHKCHWLGAGTGANGRAGRIRVERGPFHVGGGDARWIADVGGERDPAGREAVHGRGVGGELTNAGAGHVRRGERRRGRFGRLWRRQHWGSRVGGGGCIRRAAALLEGIEEIAWHASGRGRRSDGWQRGGGGRGQARERRHELGRAHRAGGDIQPLDGGNPQRLSEEDIERWWQAIRSRDGGGEDAVGAPDAEERLAALHDVPAEDRDGGDGRYGRSRRRSRRWGEGRRPEGRVDLGGSAGRNLRRGRWRRGAGGRLGFSRGGRRGGQRRRQPLAFGILSQKSLHVRARERHAHLADVVHDDALEVAEARVHVFVLRRARAFEAIQDEQIVVGIGGVAGTVLDNGERAAHRGDAHRGLDL